MPETSIHTGAECVGAQTTQGGAVMSFADGSQVEADVVLGADGIHSAVRKGLFGAGETPGYGQSGDDERHECEAAG